ncbi:sucrase ferredoxin [Actinoplanes sp. TBRC 11911]|uniref:sucrase ferredoxin n=1 Tax=Actinoplanes sp. TBRC 11911 TaxID=2729386 RepID=UPI00145E3A29|nr:sucrase ferredoxin [Actinoplanes sp. TBRC 11911]NMO50542.1 sucrase ferredoxin [Actinoplanes sp. TBRC 11911]
MPPPERDGIRFEVPVLRGWLLIEHPGPWSSSVERTVPGLPARVRSAAAEHGLRINLIRRYGSRRTETGRCFVSSFAGGVPLIEEVHREQLTGRLPSIAAALTAGRPSGLGTPLTGPIFLVCTNAQRNAACGSSGTAVARAATATAGGHAWETTHVGGCRFAANLVWLPAGVYYRGLAVAELPALVEAADRGRIVLPRYRGRAGLPPDAQAAEWAVRRVTGLDAVESVRVAGIGPADASGHRLVEVLTTRGTYRVTVHPRGQSGLRYEAVGVTGPGQHEDRPGTDRGSTPEHGPCPIIRAASERR